MIDIPGYRILRPLGRGGMASVHLAMQESVQREVALKIMAPDLMGDPQFGERFLREARIAAKLRHPHVVQVHDVGVAAGYHYMAMEYLSGGPVIARGQAPRGLRFALRVTREIASALAYAHQRGVIHRDIKPDNILLREDGAAVLTDFGIARASDNVRMTMTGSIMGTPSYMSPEQARGSELDGRADLYSLGIVFFELLIGRVPYAAQDSLSVGLMHLTAPIPRLPAELEWLQPLVDRLLAKEPAQRMQSGGELAEALADIEQRFTPTPARGTLPGFPPATPTLPLGPQEPTLGSVDATMVGAGRGPRRAASASTSGTPARRWPLLLALVLLGVGTAGWFMQDQLRALLPASQTTAALERAEQALAAGRLQRDEAGDGARELFAAVTAIDPDNVRARDGLARVGEAWLARAREALDDGRHDAARAALAQARELAVPAARIEAIESSLREASGREESLALWLEQARQARSAGNLDGDESSALMLYRRVLQIDPANALAQDGVGQVLAVLLEQGRQALANKDIATATARVERVAEIEPAHPDLPGLRARLAETQQNQGGERERLLGEGEALLARGRLTAPAGDNALARFRAVLAEDAQNARALAGLATLRGRLQAEFDRALADFNIDRADELLAALAEAGQPAARLAAARERLATAERRQQALQQNIAAQADPARLRGLLDAARDALGRGDLWGPPGESAYDHFRQVLSADPGNAEARQGIASLPQQAKTHFEAALQGGKLGRARGYVEGLEGQQSGSAELLDMKRRLSRAYAGYAAERLGAGELQRAREGFNQARELDSDNPELVQLQARLEAAGGP